MRGLWLLLLTGCTFSNEPSSIGIQLPPFAAASVGIRCDAEKAEHWIVLTESGGCEDHRELMAAPDPSKTFLAIKENGTAAELCEAGKKCVAVDVEISHAPIRAGDGVRGAWRSQALGEGRFEATWCDLIPEGAADLSVDTIAAYQIPKIDLRQPTIPLVAGKPGLLEIAVTPQVDWWPHQVTLQADLFDGERRRTLASQTMLVYSTPTQTVRAELPTGVLRPQDQLEISITDPWSCVPPAPEILPLEVRRPRHLASPWCRSSFKRHFRTPPPPPCTSWRRHCWPTCPSRRPS